MDCVEIIEQTGIVPVIKIDKPEKAPFVADALFRAGIPIAEITFRSDAAEKSIGLLKREFPGMLIAAGTVLTVENLEKAFNADADFIVSPAFNPVIVDRCIEMGKIIFPGVNNPTLVDMGVSKGLKVLKFFPVEVSGGIEMLKMLQPIFSGTRFFTSGGINNSNIMSYLACPNVIACAGSWMVRSDLVEAGDYESIYRLSKETADVIKNGRQELSGEKYA